MTGSVFGIALSGLAAARAGLSTVSHNISNAGTPGFSRQEVVQNAADAQGFGFGYIGQGVDIKDVRRNYSDFLNGQVTQSSSDASYFDAYNTQMKRVDSLFADNSAGLSTSLSDFFSAAQDLTTRPNDGAARQNFLSTSGALANRFNTLDGSLTDLRRATNQQVEGAVKSVNDLTGQIAELNKQIVIGSNQGVHATTPNDLLDKRDSLIKQLSGQIQTTVVPQGDGSVNVFLANGQAVVVRDKSMDITSQRDPLNPEDLQLGLTLNPGTANQKLIRFSPSDLGTGALAGYLQFREGPLSEYQNKLGMMSAELENQVNTINSAGVDQNGAAGTNLFTTNAARVVSGLNNTGTGSVAVTGINVSQLTGDDYEFKVDSGVLNYRKLGSNANYTPVTQTSAGPPAAYAIQNTAVTPAVNMVSFQLSGTPANGDQFVIMPTRDAAKNMAVIATDPSQIAAAKVAGAPGDNSNLLDITALQTKPVLFQALSGSSGQSISTAYNQLVSTVGNKTREIGLTADARKSVLDQATQAQQEISGVNLDEEAANLLKYQQAYQASGRVISLSKELFDLVISLTGR